MAINKFLFTECEYENTRIFQIKQDHLITFNFLHCWTKENNLII